MPFRPGLGGEETADLMATTVNAGDLPDLTCNIDGPAHAGRRLIVTMVVWATLWHRARK
jgi:hypothetical protein